MGSLKKKLKRAKGISTRGNVGPYREKLDKLKDMVLNSDDLSSIMRYFFDNISEHPGFISIGNTVKRPLLEEVIKTASKRAGKEGKVSRMMLIKLPDYPMLHGPLFIDGLPATLVFFEDIKSGVLCISDTHTFQNDFVRITVMTEQEADNLRTVQ